MAKGKEISTLFITIGLDDKDMTKGLNKAQKEIKVWSKNFAIAGAAITAALGLATKAALEEEVGVNRLRNALKNAGSDYNTLSGEIEKNIAAMQASTNFSDSEQRDALTNLIGILGSYEKAAAALPAALDAAAFSGRNLSSVVFTLGRALSGEVNTAESVGITFNETADFGTRLKQVLERVGGSAKASADPLTQLKNVTGDLVEAIGGFLVPILRTLVEKIIPIIKGVQDWIEKNEGLSKALTISAAAAGIFLGVMGSLGMIMAPLAKGLTLVIVTLGWLSRTYLGLMVRAIAYNVILVAQTVIAKAAAAAIRFLSLAMITTPWGVVITAVLALGYAVYGLVKLFQSNTDSVNKNAAATRQLTAEQKKLNDEYQKLNEAQRKNEASLTNIQNAYNATKESNAGMNREIENTEHALANSRYELGKARDALDAIQKSYDNAAQQVNEFESAISDANRELEKLTNPRLEGMQEFEDQIQTLQTKINDLEVKRAEIRVKGGDTENIDKKIEELQNQIDLLEAKETAAFDDILYKTKESVETIQGLNEEIAPEAVTERVSELGILLQGLAAGRLAAQVNLDAQTVALNNQKTVVAELEAQEAEHQARLEEIKNYVENILWSYQMQIRATEDIINNTNTEISRVEQLKAAADKTLDGMLEDSILIKNNLANTGVNPVSNTLTIPSYAGWEGPVPGPVGKPYLAMVHGGEIISQSGAGGITNDASAIRSAIRDGLAGMTITVNVGGKDVAAVISREQYSKKQQRI